MSGNENSEWQKRKVAEWQKEIAEKQDKSLKIKVETDGDVLKELAVENAELRQKAGQTEDLETIKEQRDDYREKLNLIAEQDLERKMRELHVPESEKAHFREFPQELLGYAKAKEEMQKHEVPSGNAPLSQ